MPNADRRLVLRLRYLDSEDWEDVLFIAYGGKPDFNEKSRQLQAAGIPPPQASVDRAGGNFRKRIEDFSHGQDSSISQNREH
ncbi:MAG: hypothetical protein ACLR1P_08295 [Oscillospiraceae bacterium]